MGRVLVHSDVVRAQQLQARAPIHLCSQTTSDASHLLSEPCLEDDGNGCSLVSAQVMGTKSMQRENRANVPVDAVVHGHCLDGRCWARPWLEARKRVGMDVGVQRCLMPVVAGSGDILAEPADSAQVAKALISVLSRGGARPQALEGIGSHSLKRTFLSWAAKYGLPREDRRILGYHSAGSGAVEDYAYDEMAAPMARLWDMKLAIRNGDFAPDARRVFRWAMPLWRRYP